MNNSDYLMVRNRRIPSLDELTQREESVFQDHLADEDAVAERLASCLRKLKLIASTGPRNDSIDLAAAAKHGMSVVHTSYTSTPTIELTWALILVSARHIVSEATSVRSGGWQRSIGDYMAGKTLGIIGPGNVGSGVAKVGLASGMNVTAWSQNLTSVAAEAVGARLVSKEELLQTADVVSILTVLSPRPVGLIGAAELAMMKSSARLINTSRGPIVVEAALVDALVNHDCRCGNRRL
jgi:phosphoglycerate dehydrogenase-like enzyme